MGTEIISFQDAVDQVEDTDTHVLLGNGFSMACRSDIFAYQALFERADFDRLSTNAQETFEALDTEDFEVVMRALKNASALIRHYGGSGSLADRMHEDAKALKEILVSAIAGSHPAKPSDIGDESYHACRRFLSHFKKVYTFNYDLLLYWATMQEELGLEESFEIEKPDDGFREPESGNEDYVSWEPENTYNQNIHYLHGALHIFDDRTEIQKYTWSKTGVRLIDQIRQALEEGKYPLFVAEGKSDQKLDKIRHSDFLSKAYRSFLNIGKPLFIHGHSLDENDEHFLKLIEKGKVEKLFISVYGDPSNSRNRDKISRGKALADAREQINQRKEQVHPRRRRYPLDVEFYDAESANVWG